MEELEVLLPEITCTLLPHIQWNSMKFSSVCPILEEAKARVGIEPATVLL